MIVFLLQVGEERFDDARLDLFLNLHLILSERLRLVFVFFVLVWDGNIKSV